MVEFLAAQQFLVGAVLVWAGVFKVTSSSVPLVARRSALRRLVGAERVTGAFRALGAVELVLAALLLMPPSHPVEPILAAGAFAGMLAYLVYVRRVAPDSSCGCLGESTVPVRWRAFARAGLLLAASALAAFADSIMTPVVAAVLLVELSVVAALSPELDRYWLVPLRRARVRVSHPLAGTPDTVPLASTVDQLRASDVFKANERALRSDLLDTWDEGEWRILAYTATGGTAVFAVPLHRFAPEEIRLAVVPSEPISV
ncbi:hypothetical protein EV193_11676 [Herbihabitans rhizosphaerae]|uniref:Methylamine utilisation protein MauE domain-containing protein n=1 Tax=Herbihabitans rhizosphaerae TaxID=1872711 RepID=A0A4Q7KD21_9PSEU|nr:MauE/DoxX family redox-associated membrane protein [Herbihabitans rhizosphaerae]RZS30555.1 hypothetical protein EV193_11676 [Herbihabitans rhizosphaerae]